MRFESLDGALCLVASVVAGGDQFELYLLLVDVLLESIRCFVVQRVLFYSKSCDSHSVDNFFVCPYHFLLRAIVHWFGKYIICIKVGGRHYIPVASLRCEGECSRMMGVDGISEVVDAEKSLLRFGDGYLVER